MRLEEIYFVSQVVAALAIVGSLIFVGLQIRHATRVVKATSHHAITDSFNQLNARLTDPEMQRIWRGGNEDPHRLGENERLAWGTMMLAYMRIYETLYFQRRNGTMDEELYQSELRTLEWFAPQKGFRAYWAGNPISFSDEFRAFIAEIIERSGEPVGYMESFGLD